VDSLVLERDGCVVTLRLNRPERRNAIGQDFMLEIERAALSLRDDEHCRAVVICGAGPHFSVGADMSPPPGPAVETPSLLKRRRAVELGARLMRAIQEIPQPTIAMVHGVAAGAGACIASAADFRVAADTARVGYGEVKLGMSLMWNALPVCVSLVGVPRAKQMLMSGALFDAPVLERWGFFDEIVPAEELASTARAWADRYAGLPPIPVQMIKRSVNAVAGALGPALMHMDADQFLLTQTSNDFSEAVAAFLEKRPGNYSGS
jgi:enoyl-CoA hydratase/carnithine racemase